MAGRTNAGVVDGRRHDGHALGAGERGVPAARGRGGRVRLGQGGRGGSASCGATGGSVDHGCGLQLPDRAWGRG